MPVYNKVQTPEEEGIILTSADGAWKDKQGKAETLIIAIFIQYYWLIRQAKIKTVF